MHRLCQRSLGRVLQEQPRGEYITFSISVGKQLPAIILALFLTVLQGSAMSFHESDIAFKSEILHTHAASGYRNRASGGFNNVGSNGYCWSARANSADNANNLNFGSGNVNPLNGNNRANGFSVRAVRACNACAYGFNTMTFSRDQIHELTTIASLNARKQIRNHFHALQFEVNMKNEIYSLADNLYNRRHLPLASECFMIDNPALREVIAPHFIDAVESHVLFGLANPIFERTFIFDSYSCRKNKGVLFGIERFEHMIRSVTDNYRQKAWLLNIDISGYFMAICKGIAYSIICDTLERFRYRPIHHYTTQTWDEVLDFNFIDYLFRLELFNNPMDNCVKIGNQRLREIIPPNKLLENSPLGAGVPIGRVTNQMISNIYLDVLDQYAKRDLKIKHYCRYVDDSKCLSTDLIFLEEMKCAIIEFLHSELKLTAHPRKTCIVSTDETLQFLGAHIRPYRKYASNTTVQRFRDAIERCEIAYKLGDYDINQMLSVINSYLGHLNHFAEKKTVKMSLENSPLNEIFVFKNNYKKAKIIKT